MTDMLEKVKDLNPAAHAKIVEHHKLLPYKPVDIVGLCKSIDGVRVELSASLGQGISGCIIKTGGDSFCLIADSLDPPTRQRFTFAHELSHFLLHKDDIGDKFPESILLRSGLSNQKEWEANRLAADILMPRPAIYEYMRNSKSYSINQLAKVFDVSPAAIGVRLGVPVD